MKPAKMLPPGYLLAAMIAMIILHFSLPLKNLLPIPWNLLGVIPLASGVIMNVVADQAFHRVGTTVRPFENSSRLVTDGLFKVSRNPMYLGFVLVLVGIGAILGSLTPFIVAVVFAVLIDRNFIVLEERLLAERFGEQWQIYAARTRRWL
jgi:protein-S-isoprenylcysteine O-methyltransferase Ste14